nr:nucleotidyltransferase domain-containing protein [Marinicella sp. W31]MDC2878246.1 nucleotidyltransferase domain-containing protein [Marinicella sp. W31]
MKRFEHIQLQRREAHLDSANAAWAELSAKLYDLGVEYRLFGSYVEGSFLEHSDIDLMIMGDLSTDTRQRVRRAVSAAQASWDIEFDMYFAADLTPQACEALLGN